MTMAEQRAHQRQRRGPLARALPLCPLVLALLLLAPFSSPATLASAQATITATEGSARADVIGSAEATAADVTSTPAEAAEETSKLLLVAQQSFSNQSLLSLAAADSHRERGTTLRPLLPCS